MPKEVTKILTEVPSTKASPISVALVELVKRDDIDPDRIQKFLDMQLQMENRENEKRYFAALSKFQGSCPTIIQKKRVNFKAVDYTYAPLDEIVEVIRPHLQENGLSFCFDVEINGDEMIVTTEIYHIDGFKKSYPYKTFSLHDDGRMNLSQRRKSAITYAKRAGLENALGLVTTGSDDDAKRAIDKSISKEQIDIIKSLLDKTNTKLESFLAYAKVENLEQLSHYEAKKAMTALKQKRAR